VAFGYFLVALVAAAVAIFALQNSEPTRVQFLFWHVDGAPISAVILIALAAGLIVAGLPLLIQRWRLRVRVRTLQARVADLESTRGRLPEPPPPHVPLTS
jgi:uncharacterized integral membrane protein